MYEVGDKVIYQGADKNAYKKVGVLKSIEEKDGKPQLTVEFEGGETFTAPVDDWSKEFTNACKNAKFKTGDFVKIVSGDMKGQGVVITKITGDVVEVKDNDGYKWEVGQEDIVANSCACVSTNSVVRNAMAAKNAVVMNIQSEYEVTFKDGYKKWYESYGGKDLWRATYVMRQMHGAPVKFKDDTGKEIPISEIKPAWENSCAANSVVANALKACGNAIGDINFDMKGVYETAKKMISAGATHKSGYYWSIPKTYATGVGVVASRVGGAVKVVRDDPDRQGFVIAEVTDPLAQALERKGVMNACGTAKNAKFATDQYEFDMLHEAADKLEEVAKSIYYQGDKSTYAKYKDEIKRLADRAFRISQHG